MSFASLSVINVFRRYVKLGISPYGLFYFSFVRSGRRTIAPPRILTLVKPVPEIRAIFILILNCNRTPMYSRNDSLIIGEQ